LTGPDVLMTVQEYENSYTATKKAYDEVIKFEKLTSIQQLYTPKKDQEDAIRDYIEMKMPEISEETFPYGSLNIFIIYLFLIRLHKMYFEHIILFIQSYEVYTQFYRE